MDETFVLKVLYKLNKKRSVSDIEQGLWTKLQLERTDGSNEWCKSG